ncbi:Oidioi.mRNA.OKI2018_I69.PAR.g12079.t1.cds [Oikopleura dioica]|uniref:Oidioi.mRNA.OKI2018_I69.PAR.g12079.t1.cds n=1 Tax=Oikopleura dioica TaxID=34765 RepID=A0ABN7S1R0_OIKDI|nr:Oidioi.mRNA.OKI2018_I69.PAR.g12079.t1.cds [Oikopleura dioica]
MNENLTKLATADDDGRIRVADVSKAEGEPKIKAFRAKHENLATAVEWTTDQILTSASSDQSIRTWRVDQQKCVKTLDVSQFKNEIREESTETRVNVSPPLVHTISILRNSDPEFVLAGCENGTIVSNKLECGKLSSNKMLTQAFKGSHSFGIGKICNYSLNDRWLVVSGGNDNAVKFWTAEAEERSLKFSSLGLALAALSLLSTLDLDFNLWREAAALQLQYSFLTASNRTATRLSLDFFHKKFECCGINGPGDFAKENPIIKLFAGQNAVPLWFQEYGFVRVDPTPPPTVSPPKINPDGSLNPNEHDIPLNSSSLPGGFTCTGCTININDPAPQVPVQQIPTTTPQPTTKSRRWKDTRNDRTLPWTYQRANYPWFMGPPLRGTFCEEEPCTTQRLGREASAEFPFNEESLFSQNFLIPKELNLSPGDFPVPESCCERQSKFCGLENSILRQKLPARTLVPSVNISDICLTNNSDPINSTVPSPCLPSNTSTTAIPTTTTAPIENVVDNIFTEGCFPSLFEKLSAAKWLPTVLFGHILVILNLFLNVSFGCLMCCVTQGKPERHVKYGKKHKVPVSRRL